MKNKLMINEFKILNNENERLDYITENLLDNSISEGEKYYFQ